LSPYRGCLALDPIGTTFSASFWDATLAIWSPGSKRTGDPATQDDTPLCASRPVAGRWIPAPRLRGDKLRGNDATRACPQSPRPRNVAPSAPHSPEWMGMIK
jgi:hypothetical protein